MAQRFASSFKTAVAGIALILASAPSAAQQAGERSDTLSAPAWQTPADQRDAQFWERALGLSDELLVQLAMVHGLDPVRAELLRDIFQEERAARRGYVSGAIDGQMTRKELRSAAANNRSRTDAKVQAILTPAEILWLDREGARIHAARVLEELDLAK